MKNLFRTDSGILTVGRSKAKMAFDLLEKEMDILYGHELRQFKGGGAWDPGTDCVFKTMSHLSNKLGCGQSVNYFEDSYDNMYGSGSSGSGVQGPNLSEFVSSYFSKTGAGGSESTMDAHHSMGREVMIVFQTASGTHHAVSYDPDNDSNSGNTVSVHDEQTGEDYSINSSQITTSYAVW